MYFEPAIAIMLVLGFLVVAVSSRLNCLSESGNLIIGILLGLFLVAYIGISMVSGAYTVSGIVCDKQITASHNYIQIEGGEVYWVSEDRDFVRIAEGDLVELNIISIPGSSARVDSLRIIRKSQPDKCGS